MRVLSIYLFVALLAAAAWLIALISVLVHSGPFRYGSQLIWVLVILLAGPVGALVYLVLGPHRPERPEPEAVPSREQRAKAIADPWSD